MFRDTVRDIAAEIKANRLRNNLILTAGYLFFILSAVLSGSFYPLFFFVFFVFFWMLTMTAARPDTDCICVYMTPFSDEERKKRHILRLTVCSALFSLIMLSGNIAAMIFGGHRKIHDYFICILLFHIMLFLAVLNNSFDSHSHKSKKVSERFIDAGYYAAAVAVFVVAVSLFHEDRESVIFYLDWDITTDFGYAGTALIETAVTAVQLIILKYNISGQLLYEFRKNAESKNDTGKGRK